MTAELKGDREIVLAAVQQYGDALDMQQQVKRRSRDCLAAVQQMGALGFAAAELKGTVLAAVQQYGYALGFAAAELKGDREIVLALQQHGYALGFAAAELKGDREIVLAAVARCKNMQQELKGDRSFDMFGNWRYALQYASEELNDSTVPRQRQYLATQEGATGRILLRLYRAELSLYC